MVLHILLVEDDDRISDITSQYLQNYNPEWKVDTADNGTTGLRMAKNGSYDIILLDVMLPGMSGFSVCREIRSESKVPIIFLTARTAEEDVLNGYALGGDDYITKPYSLAQLAAKINAMLSRMVRTDVICIEDLCLRPADAVITLGGEPLSLPYKEYQILKYLMEHPNTLVTKETLIVQVWDWDADVTERVLDNHIKMIRKLIAASKVKIVTLRKQGYRMEEKV